ncbi:MAG: pancreas/duodenum homeobox protein 1 [Desulfobulbaceae bacterium]|nr:pancreas/duodenum homeobox protein 1 [Desulfobulbaceae bacterium]
MDNQTLKTTFSNDVLNRLFPAERTSDFFTALFGDDKEGAFDIKLRFGGYSRQNESLEFFLDLHERPGCCLVCNLTYGLPEVFSRHPVINIKKLVQDIEETLGGTVQCTGWKLGTTRQVDRSLHSIPLTISLAPV